MTLTLFIIIWWAKGNQYKDFFKKIISKKNIKLGNKTKISNPLYHNKITYKTVLFYFLVMSACSLLIFENLGFTFYLFPFSYNTHESNLFLYSVESEVLSNIWACMPNLDFIDMCRVMLQIWESELNPNEVYTSWLFLKYFIRYDNFTFYIGMILLILSIVKHNKLCIKRSFIILVISFSLYFVITFVHFQSLQYEYRNCAHFVNKLIANGKIEVDENNQEYYNLIEEYKKEHMDSPFGDALIYSFKIISEPIIK